MIKFLTGTMAVLIGLACLAGPSYAGVFASENTTMTGTVTVLPGTEAPPAGGGGGGVSSGSGVVGEKRTTYLLFLTTQTGLILEDIEVLSVDVYVILLIKKDTIAQNWNGFPLSTVTVEKLIAPPDIPWNIEMIGGAYDITPNGASFEPPVPLTLKYDETSLPQGILENNLYIATWNAGNNAWENIGGTVDPASNTITVNINHLSIYTIMANARPAELKLSDLMVNPLEARVGEDVTVSVLATNIGDLIGGYTISLSIDGLAPQAKEVTLAGGASEKVSFSVIPVADGEHTVAIGDLTGTFKVKEALLPTATSPVTTPAPAQASFTLSSLAVTPAEIRPEEKVTVTAVVTNTGGSEGTYTAVLKINDAEEAAKQVTVAPGQSQTVSFPTTRAAPGSYKVNVNEKAGQFTVIPQPQIPEPAEALPVSPGTNWLLVAGIVLGGIIIVGLGIYLLKLRKRGASRQLRP